MYKYENPLISTVDTLTKTAAFACCGFQLSTIAMCSYTIAHPHKYTLYNIHLYTVVYLHMQLYTCIQLYTCKQMLHACTVCEHKLYACIQMCTQNFILCTASAESPSEKLKTAVLIVSLSWQEMGGFRGTVEPPIEEVSGAQWDPIMAHLHPGWLI